MAAALVQVCVDPRLNHELIRLQVRQRLERSGLRADRTYVLNEVGGSPGANFRHTAELLVRTGEPIVFCAVLHHDECLVAREGQPTDLAAAAREMAEELARLKLRCRVLTGRIRTANNHLLWPFTFGSG